MRIAVGGFMHETNTFVPIPTAWRDFDLGGPWPRYTEGEAIRTAFAGLNLALPHFMAGVERAGHETVPLAWASAMPAGRVTDETFERMATTLASGLRASRPDAVFLELHGAMVTESHDDAEGELLRRVRDTVGAGVPILASLDLHANVSPEMVARVDFFSSYRTYPHVDWGAAGARCAEWFDRVAAWGRPARAIRQSPFLVPVTAGCTYVEPSGGLYERLKEIEARTGVHLSLNMGFPPADIRDVGPSVIAYGADQGAVDAAADELFDALLAAEAAFARHNPEPAEDAVRRALDLSRSAKRPIVLADTQDNPGAGCPSNTTGLIAELLRQGAQRAVVGNFHDAAAATKAHAVGIGGTIEALGGGASGPGQEPLPGPWRVAGLSDGAFQGTSPMLRAKVVQLGPTALLAKDGVEVLAVSLRQQPLHRENFSHIGVDLASRAIVAVKSSAHFRSAFQEIAEEVIVTLSPGMNPEDPGRFEFSKLRPGVRVRPRGE